VNRRPVTDCRLGLGHVIHALNAASVDHLNGLPARG
jgi:hypothetical protein